MLLSPRRRRPVGIALLDAAGGIVSLFVGEEVGNDAHLAAPGDPHERGQVITRRAEPGPVRGVSAEPDRGEQGAFVADRDVVRSERERAVRRCDRREVHQAVEGPVLDVRHGTRQPDADRAERPGLARARATDPAFGDEVRAAGDEEDPPRVVQARGNGPRPDVAAR